MSVQVRRRREAAPFISTFVGAQGELIVDTTNRRILVQDGVTAGGIPANGAYAPNGSFLQLNTLEGEIETITPGGTTYLTTVQVPARAMVVGVSHRIIIPITGCTQFEIGVSGTPNMFAIGLGTTAGSSNVGIGGPNTFYSATSLLLSSTLGGVFTGGTIRLSIQYLTVGAPTA